MVLRGALRPLLTSVIVAATLVGCQMTPQSERNFTVLYTNDEHGWMEGMGGVEYRGKFNAAVERFRRLLGDDGAGLSPLKRR